MQFFAFVVTLLLGILVGVWKAAVAMWIWNWFMPAFWPMLPMVSLAQAWVVCAVVTLVCPTPRLDLNKKQDWEEALIEGVTLSLLYFIGYTIILFIMWVAWHFIMPGRI